jgi:thiol-disulfide isomerase/thioredoxin
VWSKPPVAKATEAAESRWETPKKPIPAFELAGLDGKTWRLKQFEGKSLLINIWATWCGPCQAELPLVEKLHQQTKDSAEIQVITLNIDEELGLVEPFMKKKGYTFPVLPAMSLVHGLLDGNVAIPQNWLVNPKGDWVQIQIGYDRSEADWPAMMMKKLKALK